MRWSDYRSGRFLAAPVLALVFMDPLARSPIGVTVTPAIRRPVVRGSVVARVGVGGRVRVGRRVVAVAVPWIGVGGRVIAVPIAVGRIAVAIVGPGASRQRPKCEAADKTC